MHPRVLLLLLFLAFLALACSRSAPSLMMVDTDNIQAEDDTKSTLKTDQGGGGDSDIGEDEIDSSVETEDLDEEPSSDHTPGHDCPFDCTLRNRCDNRGGTVHDLYSCEAGYDVCCEFKPTTTDDDPGPEPDEDCPFDCTRRYRCETRGGMVHGQYGCETGYDVCCEFNPITTDDDNEGCAFFCIAKRWCDMGRGTVHEDLPCEGADVCCELF